MYTRHDELPVLSAWPTQVDARTFNAALRALARADSPIRLDLPEFYRLQLILQPGSWVVVDTASNEMPITAWVNFSAGPDRGLHEPVTCELRYFHGVSAKVAGHLRAGLGEMLEDRMAPAAPDTGPSVIGFRSQT